MSYPPILLYLLVCLTNAPSRCRDAGYFELADALEAALKLVNKEVNKLE